MDMTEHRNIRLALLVVQSFVAVTAIAGGVALVIGSLYPTLSTALIPPPEYLEGSPFDSYLIPGLTLAVVLGGVHLAAFVFVRLWNRFAMLVAAAAGYAALIWIFVQMIVIPFSFLQTVYFAAGLLELGLVLLLLGVHRPVGPQRQATTHHTSRSALARS
jgi:hypothetical protein